jgi:uncharacterized membrane protein YfcA
MIGAWREIVLAIVGVIAGTIWGGRLLRRIPETTFRRTVAILVLLLGIYMLVVGIRGRS